jgi:hypothetical protein
MINCSPSWKASDYAEQQHGRSGRGQPLATAMRHNPGHGIMRQFVRKRRGIALGIAESLEWRHLHIVGTFGIEGAGAAVSDVGMGRGKEPLGMVKPLHRGEGRRLRHRAEICRQAFALFRIEDGVPLHIEDVAYDLLAIIVGFCVRELLAKTTSSPFSPLRTLPPSSIACLKVSQIGQA